MGVLTVLLQLSYECDASTTIAAFTDPDVLYKSFQALSPKVMGNSTKFLLFIGLGTSASGSSYSYPASPAENCVDITSTYNTSWGVSGSGPSSFGWPSSISIANPNSLASTPINLSMSLKSTCDQQYNVVMVFGSARGGAWADDQNSRSYLENVVIPPRRTCSVDINTSPSIPVITPGNSVDTISLTTSAVGSGSLMFKPDSLNGTVGTLKNSNGNSLTYWVVDANLDAKWSASDSLWKGNLNTDYLLKLGDVAKTMPSGVYKGSMTATLSCD